MAVVARFYVSEIVRRAYDPSAVTVKMNAVSRGEENKQWAAATPSGSLEMTIKASGAAAWFADRLSQEVLLTIDVAPEPAPAPH